MPAGGNDWSQECGRLWEINPAKHIREDDSPKERFKCGMEIHHSGCNVRNALMCGSTF